MHDINFIVWTFIDVLLGMAWPEQSASIIKGMGASLVRFSEIHGLAVILVNGFVSVR